MEFGWIWAAMRPWQILTPKCAQCCERCRACAEMSNCYRTSIQHIPILESEHPLLLVALCSQEFENRKRLENRVEVHLKREVTPQSSQHCNLSHLMRSHESI